MIGDRFTGVAAPALLILVAFFIPTTTAGTATLNIPTGLPASCTPLATLLSEYPPPVEGKALDDALNSGLDALYTRYEATATATAAGSLSNKTTICDYIISTQIPSATPSVTSALSSYISAAGIWLEDHGLQEAESLLYGDCQSVVQPGDEDAIGDLDFVIGFGECYKILSWDQRTSSNPDATTTDVTTTHATTTDAATTKASSTSTATPSRTGSAGTITSPTSQPSETSVPPNAGVRREGDLLWILATVMCVTLFYL
ncbi:hypothetical protein F4859DRAFT_517325 [Xylaria cf. heliscus]|nr:hypothetical protein F4859DRAFT_517325 [Xylaria cf. heliscus]